MKLIQYLLGHPKNTESMKRMCAAYNIEYECTFDRDRLRRPDYTIAWIPMQWISPDEFPPNVYILYGPQFFVLPEGPLCGKLNDTWSKRSVYTCLCKWNIGVYAEFSDSFVIPMKPFFFGVSDSIADVSTNEKTLDCVIYIKRRDPFHVMRVQEELDKRNLSYEIFEYGSYDNSVYFDTLKRAKFCIWLGTHESQGFCFQETLVSNTPILLWDATSMFFEFNSEGSEFKAFIGIKELRSTTANLWSDDCGLKMEESMIGESIDTMCRSYKQFKPRSFILEHASDKVCMARILDHFGI
jgi:hypothetical protein